MIPKIIHYCWFGGKSLPESVLKYIQSWKTHYPDWEIKQWDERNSPMHLPYMQTAMENKNWANMSNFVRLFAIERFGGIYFDTDVEVLKPFDFVDSRFCYFCLDTKPDVSKYFVNNAVIVACPGNEFISQSVISFLNQFDGSESADISSPVFITNELNKIGFKGKPGAYNNVKVLPNYFFYPSSWNERHEKHHLKEETYTIHYSDASWLKVEELDRDYLVHIIKDLDLYKNKYKLLKAGHMSFIDLIKLNLKFFLKLFN